MSEVIIAAGIPGAIRDCSPVVSLVGTAGGDVCFGKGARAVVSEVDSTLPHRPLLLIDGGWFAASEFALVVSDPTGAAHLAWWLLYGTKARTADEHAANLAAIGATLAEFHAAVELARVGLGAMIDTRGREILRDYAHRVAGVTNG